METWSFLGPGDEDERYGTHTCRPEGKWNTTVDDMVEHYKETGHPAFLGGRALNRGILKRKGGHFNADSSNTGFCVLHS